MDIGDYYSKSISEFTKNPNLAIPALVGNVLKYVILILGLIIAFLLIVGPVYFSNPAFSPNMMNNPDLGTIALVCIIFAVISFIIALIYSFMNAATIGMSKTIINGEKPELNVGLKNGKKYFIKIFLVSLIIGIIWLIITIPIILGFILDYMYGIFGLTIIGGLISLIGYIIVAVLFIFAYQSIVVCKKSVISSLKDSIKVFRKNIFEVSIVLIINAVILLGIWAVLFFINMFLGLIPIVGSIISIIIDIVVSTLTIPYFTLVLTYLYMDLKGKLPGYK